MIQTETSKAKIIFVSVPDNTEKSKIHHYKNIPKNNNNNF